MCSQIVLQKVRRELAVWMDLRHKNIVPFVGIAYGLDDERKERASYFPAILSLRMMNGIYNIKDDVTITNHHIGDLVDFLKKDVDCDKGALPLQIAQGLRYLHRMRTTYSVHCPRSPYNRL